MDNEQLVKSIRQLCKNRNIAISQLENDLNFGAGLISRWSKNSPSIDKIVDIADYFHISLDEVVGYTQDDIFLTMLCDLTNSKKIKWSAIDINTTEKVANPHRDIQFEAYDEDKYTEKSYFTKYKDGFIIIYAFHEYGKLINPDELFLYIQPSENQIEYAWQDYYTNDLKSLWINILSNVDEVSVEVKAEQLKAAFITEFYETNKISDSKDTASTQNKRKLFFAFNPHNNKVDLSITVSLQNVLQNPNGCVLYNILNNKVIDQEECKDITSIGKNFYIKHKDNLGDIWQAHMFNGKTLTLISDNRIIKLSGFSSGKQHDNVGFDGLLYLLKDAGFDVSDQSKIDKENFTLNKQ